MSRDPGHTHAAGRSARSCNRRRSLMLTIYLTGRRIVGHALHEYFGLTAFTRANNFDQGSWNTHTAGARSTFCISGTKGANPVAWAPPLPTPIAMYCFPFTVYEIGALLGTSVRRVSHSSLPVWSSYAGKTRSIEPLKITPPAVSSAPL